MNVPTRREFLRAAGAASAGAAALVVGAASPGATGANDRITIGVIGLSRGKVLARAFAGHGVKIGYVCDVDDNRLERARKEANADQAVTDLRRILDDKSVDAVAIATPDHWHGPAAILACQAGKHVYVEKPCSHNIREGRSMIDTARRHNRVMQVGTQSRSTKMIREAIDLVRGGAIGEVLAAKAWNSQRRASIGHQGPSKPPPGFDYDLWVGPAPLRPFQANCHHYTWHWWYDFGTGDAGNDGVHELDIARWGLGDPDHPTRAAGFGSKLAFDDDQQFPDTQYVTFDYPATASGRSKLIVYEHRIWSPYMLQGHENGNVFYGTEGCLILGKGEGWKLYGPNNELLREASGTHSVEDHVANFLAAIRTGERPHADVEIGHRSATLAHLANILARAGAAELAFDPQREEIAGNAEAATLLGREYRDGHWAIPEGANGLSDTDVSRQGSTH